MAPSTSNARWLQWASVLLVLALPRRAVAVQAGDTEVVLSITWSADSAWAVAITQDDYESSDESQNGDLDGPPCNAKVASVFDAHSGLATRYLYEPSTDDGCSGRVSQLNTEKDRKAFDAWAKAHHTAIVKSSVHADHGDGSAVAEQGKPPWTSLVATQNAEETTSFQLCATRATKRYVLDSGHLACTMGGGIATYGTYWAPDGTALVWTAHVRCGGTDGIPATRVRFARLEGPRIDLAFDAKAVAERRAAVQASLTKQKITPLRVGTANDPHPLSQVFAAPGFEGVGKQVAQALPGSTVAPLAWKSDFDVVIAVGP